MMHIYAFGSICRGDISQESDIDLLALVERRDPRLSQEKFSIYSYKRITELWEIGNAFAWHLALESRLIYSEDGGDFLAELGTPASYEAGAIDCARFRDIFRSSLFAVEAGSPSLVFELSTIFLALRNIGTCFSLAKLEKPTFGRDSARRLGRYSLNISEKIYMLLMRSRLLSTRGTGEDIGNIDRKLLLSELARCENWVIFICREVQAGG